ncbi:MAG: hypothetical protein WCX71_02415 [Candidatus Buchananbacteria bacterium]
MITLNLIPAEKKKDIQLTQIFIVIRNSVINIFLLVSLVAIILLTSKAIIDDNFAKIVAESTLTTRYAKLFNHEIKDFNNTVQAIEKIENGFIPWSNFLVNLSGDLPNNLVIYSLELNNDKILITGFANSRNDLLELKNNFGKREELSNITIPIDNLLKKDDINFNLKADIDLSKIKNYER